MAEALGKAAAGEVITRMGTVAGTDGRRREVVVAVGAAFLVKVIGLEALAALAAGFRVAGTKRDGGLAGMP